MGWTTVPVLDLDLDIYVKTCCHLFQKIHSGRKSAPFSKDDQVEKISPTTKKTKQNKKETKKTTEPTAPVDTKTLDENGKDSESTESETKGNNIQKQSMKILSLQKKISLQV